MRKIFVVSFVSALTLSMGATAAHAESGLFKWAGKAARKVLLPVTVGISATANAAHAYSNGESIGDSLYAGAAAGAGKIGESLVETANDIGTIGCASAKIAGADICR